MRRRDARMIAEELHKLMKQDTGNELLTREEAAARLKVSKSYLSHHVDRYPCQIIRGRAMYTKRSIDAIMQKQQTPSSTTINPQKPTAL